MIESVQEENSAFYDFRKSFFIKAAQGRVPLAGGIELTPRCNLKCVHCYISDESRQESLDKLLTNEEIYSIIDDMVEEGCLWLLLSGGDPLVRKGFVDIYKYAKEQGLLLTLFTNGTLITEEIADVFAGWRPYSIEITLYGMTEETYGRVTGVPSGYTRVMKAIEFLQERQINFLLKAVVLTLNKHELWDMKKFAEDLGVQFRYDSTMFPQLDGCTKPTAYRITPEEAVALEMQDSERMDLQIKFNEKHVGPPPDLGESRYSCGAGRSSFYIDPFGNMRICLMHEPFSYNLREGSFKDGWYKFFPEVLNQPPAYKTDCHTCHYRAMCGSCPAWSYLVHQDPDKKVEYLCELTHRRVGALEEYKKKRAKALEAQASTSESCGDVNQTALYQIPPSGSSYQGSQAAIDAGGCGCKSSDGCCDNMDSSLSQIPLSVQETQGAMSTTSCGCTDSGGSCEDVSKTDLYQISLGPLN